MEIGKVKDAIASKPEMSEFVSESEHLSRFEIRAVYKDERGIPIAKHKPSKLRRIELSPIVVPYHAIYYH